MKSIQINYQFNKKYFDKTLNEEHELLAKELSVLAMISDRADPDNLFNKVQTVIS